MIRFLSLTLLVLFFNSAVAVSLKQTRTVYTLNKSLSLNDLKENASIVFRGSFEDFKIEERGGLEARLLKFKVKEVFKGIEKDKKTLVLAEWARTKSPFTEELIASDMDYVFFFYEPSKIGFTSLVGMEQGLVMVNDDKSLVFSSKLTNKKTKRRKLLFFVKEENVESYQDLKNFLDS
jgi:hypothetical protein